MVRHTAVTATEKNRVPNGAFHLREVIDLPFFVYKKQKADFAVGL